MEHKIIHKESFRVVGFANHEAMTMDNCFKKIHAFWQEVAQKGGIEQLCALMQNKTPTGILGISICEKGKYVGYYIAVATDAATPIGMEEYVIPKTTYAVFDAIGPCNQAIKKMHQTIVSEWLPTSGYKYLSGAEIEAYSEGNQQADDYCTQIWFPITNK